MKSILKYVLLLLLPLCAVGLTSCGGKTDTNGSLTLSTPVTTDNGDGTYDVTVTATFTPPAGKVPNGVVIHFVANDGLGSVSLDKTLTSAPAVVASFRIPQSTFSSSTVSITASIGDMESSVLATIPRSAPIQFSETDSASTIKTLALFGGVPPYTLLPDPNLTDLDAAIVGGTSFLVIKNIAAGTTAQTASFLIKDAANNIGTVQVNYFK